VPLGVGDRQLFPGLLLAILGDIFPRQRVAMFALEGAEELEGSAPPRALGVGTSFIGLRGRDVQDARELALVFVLHRDGSGYRRMHNRTTRMQIGDLYALLIEGTQEFFDLAAGLKAELIERVPGLGIEFDAASDCLLLHGAAISSGIAAKT